MIPIVESNIDDIVKICERMEIQSLYLFGSGSNQNRFTQKSDLDFLYKFKKENSGLYDYFDLLFALEKITGKKVDLVAEEKIKNKFFLERVNHEKIKIYEF
ncbi:MAG: nucleotidyltransferase domain-containing protein [Ginsengibacter sp.]